MSRRSVPRRSVLLGAAALGTLPVNANAAPTGNLQRWSPTTIADRLALARCAIGASQAELRVCSAAGVRIKRKGDTAYLVGVQLVPQPTVESQISEEEATA
jgi:hypothetical protein